MHTHTHTHYHKPPNVTGEELAKKFAELLTNIFDRQQRIEKRLDDLYKLVNINNHNQNTIMSDLAKLTADVAANTSVEQSAVTLIQNIATELKASSGDQAAVDALAAQLEASSAALAAAVTANTPAAPPSDGLAAGVAVTPAP